MGGGRNNNPLQYSLGALFVLMTLAAGWALELPLGIVGYVSVVLLILTWWRVRADNRFSVRRESELVMEHFLRFSMGMIAATGVAVLAIGIALFVGLFIQGRYEWLSGLLAPGSQSPPADYQGLLRIKHQGLFVSIPCATVAAATVYYLLLPGAANEERGADGG
jgi:hypothetical protein